MLDRLVDEGLTVVIAEQHRAVVEELCTSFVVLRSGEVAGVGRADVDSIDAYYQAL